MKSLRKICNTYAFDIPSVILEHEVLATKLKYETVVIS